MFTFFVCVNHLLWLLGFQYFFVGYDISVILAHKFVPDLWRARHLADLEEVISHRHRFIAMPLLCCGHQMRSVSDCRRDSGRESRVCWGNIRGCILVLVLRENRRPVAQPRSHSLGVRSSAPLSGLCNVVRNSKLATRFLVLQAGPKVATGNAHLLHVAAEILNWYFSSVTSVSVVGLQAGDVVAVSSASSVAPYCRPVVPLHSRILLRLCPCLVAHLPSDYVFDHLIRVLDFRPVP